MKINVDWYHDELRLRSVSTSLQYLQSKVISLQSCHARVENKNPVKRSWLVEVAAMDLIRPPTPECFEVACV